MKHLRMTPRIGSLEAIIISGNHPDSRKKGNGREESGVIHNIRLLEIIIIRMKRQAK